MAGSKGSKYYNVFIDYKVWLASPDGEGIIGDGRLELLKAIDKLGSIRAAADELKISYRKAWGNLKKAESLLNFPLVEKTRGGKEGGKTVLTKETKILIDAYADFHKEFNESTGIIIKKFFNKLNKVESSE